MAKKRIKDLGVTATATDLKTGNYLVLDGAEGTKKIPAEFAEGMPHLRIVGNAEYVYVVVDSNDVFLFGIKKDGSVEWAKGIPNPIRTEILDLLVGKVDKVDGKSLVDTTHADALLSSSAPEFLKIITDNSGSIIESIKLNGQHEFFVAPKFHSGIDWTEKNLTDLEIALKANGFTGGQGDWSDEESLQIQKPKFAIVNFTGISSMPTTKTENAHGVMQFWDMAGNYFKKKVIMNAQGNSSLNFIKKNIAVDLCNDEWVGDDTFKLKFGNWVSQDSFHLKAYYTDYFRGIGACAYKVYKDILDTRGSLKDRTWKQALLEENENVGEGLGYGAETDNSLRIDDGALCFPEGFPCAVYLNGSFYGLFAFQLKKHRDNYMMDKGEKTHIHLDGTLSTAFFSGTIDWTAFEIRNPKKLICMDGSDYDGDNPAELIDSTSPNYDSSKSSHVDSAFVKSKIIALAGVYSRINSASTDAEKKAIVEECFDVDNLVDYQIFSDIIYNVDGISKNWQWTTWDGTKWFANAYDLDMAFGASFKGDAIHVPVNSMLTGTALPIRYIQLYYMNELQTRYAELRKYVIVTEKIFNIVSDWVKSIGLDMYKKEYKKWPDSPCNNDMEINGDYWALKTQDGKPVISYSSSGLYNASTSYVVGDEVKCNPSSEGGSGWYYVFECVANTTGNNPIVKNAHRDSIWRLHNWIEKNIENMDVVYNYQQEA